MPEQTLPSDLRQLLSKLVKLLLQRCFLNNRRRHLASDFACITNNSSTIIAGTKLTSYTAVTTITDRNEMVCDPHRWQFGWSILMQQPPRNCL